MYTETLGESKFFLPVLPIGRCSIIFITYYKSRRHPIMSVNAVPMADRPFLSDYVDDQNDIDVFTFMFFTCCFELFLFKFFTTAV